MKEASGKISSLQGRKLMLISKNGSAMYRAGTLCFILGFSACTGRTPPVKEKLALSVTSAGSTQLAASLNLTVLDSNGRTIYDESSNSSLKLVAGSMYTMRVRGTAPPDTVLSAAITNIDLPSSLTTTLPFKFNGDTSWVASSAGDFALKLTITSASSATVASKNYSAIVTCAGPTFTATSLSGSQIAISSGAGPNLYQFDVSGVIGAANGHAPYLCALDPTGTGIQDTGFQPCNQAFGNVYVNYVSTRNVGVIVKDACNTSHAISNRVNLDYSVPTFPGSTFIYGQVSGASGNAVGDPRVDGVTYLAENSGGHNIVSANYGGGSYVINAWQSYGLPSSVSFGTQIRLAGFTDTINVSTGQGTIDASQARIAGMMYATDQAGDQTATLSFTGANCVLSNQGARVLFNQGQPCGDGKTGDNNTATVEAWGNYSCTGLSDAGGAINLAGSFDGAYTMTDSCSGGGGGGGGITPVKL